MIIDNKITDHNFVLPDVASFPEIGPPQFDTLDYDASSHIAGMEDALANCSPGKFHEHWQRLSNDLVYIFPHMDCAVYAEHKRRIENAVYLYMDSANNQIVRKRDDLNSREARCFDDVGENGYHTFSANYAETIKKELKDDIDVLRNIPDGVANPHFYDRFKNYNWSSHPRLMKMIEAELRENGVLGGMSEYNSYFKPLEVMSFALHISRPTDTHHLQTLSDCDTVTKLIGLHMDPKYNTMKVLTYLNDVDINNGPFQYIPKSHRWEYPLIERLFAYGLSTGNYLTSDLHRKIALSLPSQLRKNAIVGRFIPDDSDTQKMLSSALRSFVGVTGTSIAFDPTLGLHRGGLCDTSERINLQILLRT